MNPFQTFELISLIARIKTSSIISSSVQYWNAGRWHEKNAHFKTSRFHDGRWLCRIARGYGSEVQKESRIDHCSKLAKGSTIPNLKKRCCLWVSKCNSFSMHVILFHPLSPQERLSCPEGKDLSEGESQCAWTKTEAELRNIFTDDSGLFVVGVIWLGDCSEGGNLASLSAWWPSQAELGLATDDTFVVASQGGQKAIVWSGNLQYAHTCSVPTWWDWLEQVPVRFHSLQLFYVETLAD